MIEPLQLIRLPYLAFLKFPLRVLRWGNEAAVVSLAQEQELVKGPDE